MPQKQAPRSDWRRLTWQSPFGALTVEKGVLSALLCGRDAGGAELIGTLGGGRKRIILSLDGQEARIASPRAAIQWGVGLVRAPVFREGPLTALDCLLPASGKRAEALEKAEEKCKAWGWRLPLDAPAASLTPWEGLRLLLLARVMQGCTFLLLPRPFDGLTEPQAQELLDWLRMFVRQGGGALYLADAPRQALGSFCFPLSNGKLGEPLNAPDDEEILWTRLAEDPEDYLLERKDIFPGSVTLEVRDLTVRFRGEQTRRLSLEARAGEIMALTALPRQGLSAVAAALTGLARPKMGRIRLNGVDLTWKDARTHIRAGIGYIPAATEPMGMVSAFSLTDNLLLRRQEEREFQDGGLLRRRAARIAAEELFPLEKNATADTVTGKSLTPGERQLFIAAREADRSLRLLIAERPTQSLNRQDAADVRQLIEDVREERRAVILLTEDPEEALALADRILVMRDGAAVAELDPRLTTTREIGLLMAGAKEKGEEA